MENRNNTIDAVRGLAIFLVVYGHVIQRTMIVRGADFFLNPAFKLIYTFHMPLFVFISGYLMALSLSRRSLSDAFRSRCKSILVPFVSWGVLGIVTNYFLNAVDGKPMGINFPRDLADQLLVNPTIWFLFTLFVASGLLLYSVRLQKHLGHFGFLFIYLLLVAIPYNDYCALYYIKWFYPFYAAGYFVNKLDLKITNDFIKKIGLIVSLILFLGLAAVWNKGDYIYLNRMHLASDQYLAEVLRIIYRYAVGFLGIVVAFYIGEYLSRTKAVRFLDYVGIYSLDIYLIQRYLVEGLYQRLFAKTNINFDFSSPLFLCFYVPLVAMFYVGLCILVSNLLIRRNSWVSAFLLGNRNAQPSPA